MTMTETEELTWMRVLYIEDSPIQCSKKGCVLEAKYRHTCPGCGNERFRCNPSAHFQRNGVPVPPDTGPVRDHPGCDQIFTYEEWFARYYPI